MRKLLLLLLLPLSTLAQTTGVVVGTALDNVGNVVAGATVTVCALGSLGIPCAPVTVSGTTNGQGQFAVGPVATGTYTVTVFRSGVISTSSTVVVAPSNITVANNVTYSGSVTFGGNNTHSGTETFTGLMQCKSLENILCMDPPNSPAWSGTDIGGWSNSAYASGPTTGSEIMYACKQDGTNFSFSTPMVFQTSGKYVALRSLGPTNQNAFGCGLNYTPTTATTAMTLDFTPSGGGGYEPGDLFGIHLVNNGCVGSGGTNGGCGSSATGIKMGGTNGGAHMMKIHGRVAGFGTGINFASAAGVGWGVSFDQFGCAWNTTCLSMASFHENVHWFGGACAVNTTCISLPSGGNINLFGVSLDANLSASGWINPTGNVACVGCWYENLGAGNAGGTQNFQISTQTGGTYNFSGNITNDNASGTLAQFFTNSGGMLFYQGSIFSAGQTTTNVMNNTGGGQGRLTYFSTSPSLVGAPCSVPAGCIVERYGFTGGPQMDVPVIRIPSDTLGTITGAASYVVCHMDAANSDLRCNTNNGGFTHMPQSVGAFTTNHAMSVNNTLGDVKDSGLAMPAAAGSATVTQTIASGTQTLTSGAITAATCQARVSSTATGALTTDTISWAYVTAPTVTTDALLTIAPDVSSAGNVGFTRCNPTAGSITGTAIVINWRIVR